MASSVGLGCQPAAFPRTADVAPSGGLSAEAHLQALSFEPQTVRLDDGRTLSSPISFAPIAHVALRGGFGGGLGGCEAGGFFAMPRVGGELRCGVLQERLGDPISVAVSGAGGLDYGYVFGAFGRMGVEVSRWFGRIAPMVNLHLSTAEQYRYIEDPEDVPIEGPFGGAKSIERREIRATLPLGIAFAVARTEIPARTYAIVLGATPWWVLRSIGAASEDTPRPIAWEGERGLSLSLGLLVRSE
jgi:hypothetical protein